MRRRLPAMRSNTFSSPGRPAILYEQHSIPTPGKDDDGTIGSITEGTLKNSDGVIPKGGIEHFQRSQGVSSGARSYPLVSFIFIY